MISRGDDSARNAFRAALREETPLPTVQVNATQELDARDILEVQELANAIARAEQSTPVLSRASSRPKNDIFDRLAKPTDDASGPALPAPIIPLPPSTQPMLDATEDAYYHPGGRVRSFADVTLDGYRVESTLQVRIRERRSKVKWIVLALLLPLSVIAVGGALYSRSSEPTPVAVTTTTQAVAPKAEPQKIEAKKVDPPPARVVEAPKKDDVPVFDVNKLPTAKKK